MLRYIKFEEDPKEVIFPNNEVKVFFSFLLLIYKEENFLISNPDINIGPGRPKVKYPREKSFVEKVKKVNKKRKGDNTNKPTNYKRTKENKN